MSSRVAAFLDEFDRLPEAQLGAAAAILVADAGLAYLAIHVIRFGVPSGVGFGWTPGLLSCFMAYPIYLLRRFRWPERRPLGLRYPYFWVAALVLPFEAVVVVRALRSVLERLPATRWGSGLVVGGPAALRSACLPGLYSEEAQVVGCRSAQFKEVHAMAGKKTKKRPTKRRSTPAKAAGSRRAASEKPARKARKTKARRRATPARKKAVAASRARPAAASAVDRRDAERKRLRREQRALERDSENRDEPSALADSPEFIPGATDDSLAAELGEGALESAVSGGQAAEDIRDEDVDEDEGGPFVQTSGRQEFARDTDGSNPKDGEPAAFPTPGPRRR